MTSKARALRLIRWAGLILGIGLAYACFVLWTGLAVPCPFHAVTGLQCPGCGVTRMCLALLRLNFAAAWAANPGLLVLLPLLAALFLKMAAGYVKSGRKTPTKAESTAIWVLVGVLLAYGVVRNLI